MSPATTTTGSATSHKGSFRRSSREILLRRSPLTRGKWLIFLVICVCMTVSVCYELIEWAAAELGGSSADAFLGTQGDVWDTQWDIFMALIGSIAAQLTLTRVHDRQLDALQAREQPTPVISG
ncbi:MAG: DUF2238 domain-containing protein [Gemmatimonadaceae bacterium]|nr:DUF2238 domain-containing protein [Gemmatimonadaceae bacterium]